jgi:hypothetical protein
MALQVLHDVQLTSPAAMVKLSPLLRHMLSVDRVEAPAKPGMLAWRALGRAAGVAVLGVQPAPSFTCSHVVIMGSAVDRGCYRQQHLSCAPALQLKTCHRWCGRLQYGRSMPCHGDCSGSATLQFKREIPWPPMPVVRGGRAGCSGRSVDSRTGADRLPPAFCRMSVLVVAMQQMVRCVLARTPAHPISVMLGIISKATRQRYHPACVDKRTALQAGNTCCPHCRALTPKAAHLQSAL